MLKIENLSVGYGEKTVLRDVTMTLPRGSLTAVVGPNGCGKSTLFKTVLGILPSLSGAVLLDEVPLATMKHAEIARRVSYLSQSKRLPDMTVFEMVLQGRFPHLSPFSHYGEEDRAIARSAMEKMGLLPFAETPIFRLSGGEAQRAFVAMALAQKTDVLFADEPTSFLDVQNAHALFKTLKALALEGKTVAVVSHDLPLAFRLADRVAVFAEGVLLAFDTPERVLASCAVEKAFGVPLAYSDEAGYYYRY